MIFISDWLSRLGRLVVTQPLSVEVAGCQDEYARSVGLRRLGLRVLWRKFLLILWGQSSRCVERLQPQWRKGLWIYARTAQVGDSLMDLACRNIYKDAGFQIDLLTSKNLAEFYAGDAWFDRVSSSPQDFLEESYDFIIIQSVHHRAFKAKVKFFKELPWVCIQGFYDVPDFSRTEWGARRVFDLLGKSPAPEYFDYSALQKFSVQSTQFQTPSEIPLVIAVGGMDAVRTFKGWSALIQMLALDASFSEVVLIGAGESANLASEEIMQLDTGGLKITSLVGKTTLADCFNILKRAQLFVAADGGLLHLAVAASAKRIVSLFIVGIPPELRIPVNYRADALTSASGDVNDIAVRAVANKIQARI